jgi:hypothetical protein
MQRIKLALALVSAVLSCVGLADAQQTKNAPPFGITYAALLPPAALTADYVAQTMKAASELGAQSLRWQMLWQVIETSEGRFDWSLPDRIVQAAAAAQIDLVLQINGYSPDPRRTNVRGLYPAGGEEKLRAYESFVRELARRYKGQVHYWQIENEVAQPQYWGGSLDDYIAVLRTAYRALKSEDKEATVLFAGLAGVEDAAKTKFLLENGRNYFDVLDAHLYFPPEDLPGKIAGLRMAMKQIGYDKPIWVTETGGPHPCTVRSAQEPPPETQAGEVVKRYVELLSAGVERVFWFGLQRATAPPAWGCNPAAGEANFDFMMLIRNQERRLAFSTYQLMAQKLRGFTAVERLALGQGITAFRFSLNSGPVVVMWADKDRVANLAGTSGQVVVTNVSGVIRRVDPKAIPVTVSPVFVEGPR